MNIWMLIAGLLSLATAAIHALLGGPEIDAVIQASALPPIIRAVSGVMWHGLTVLFAVNGLWLIGIGMGRLPAAGAAVIAVHYVTIAAVFLVFNVSRFGGLFTLPQWTLFTAMAVLMAIGLRRA